MPNETAEAIEWAMSQYIEDDGIKIYVIKDGKINNHLLVDFVRKYFNDNDIEYSTFSFDDLKPFLSN